jgi:energy-coupling factor transporter transmembrane protein EcfT
MPAPKLPWYQFSLRSLLLLTFFVAMVCSLGAYTHWLLSVAILANVLIGGVAGRIVGEARSGFVQGVVFAILFFLIAFIYCTLSMGASPGLWNVVWWFLICGFAMLVGGIVGGLSVRPGSRR